MKFKALCGGIVLALSVPAYASVQNLSCQVSSVMGDVSGDLMVMDHGHAKSAVFVSELMGTYTCQGAGLEALFCANPNDSDQLDSDPTNDDVMVLSLSDSSEEGSSLKNYTGTLTSQAGIPADSVTCSEIPEVPASDNNY